MKLKSDLITQNIGGQQFLVSISGDSFNGIVRNNRTAAFIVDCLKKETTESEIIDAMCGKFDAPREEISADVKEIVKKLRSIDAIED